MNNMERIICNYIRSNWCNCPNWLKNIIHNTALIIVETPLVHISLIDSIADEILSEVENESERFIQMIHDALLDIEEGRVHKVPDGVSVSEWLQSIIDEED